MCVCVRKYIWAGWRLCVVAGSGVAVVVVVVVVGPACGWGWASVFRGGGRGGLGRGAEGWIYGFRAFVEK